MDRYYPGSEDVVRMREALEGLGAVVDLDERGAEEKVETFARELEKATFDSNDIMKIVSRAEDMRQIGIKGAPTKTAVLESAKKVIDSDWEGSFRTFCSEKHFWGQPPYNHDMQTLDELCDYCMNRHKAEHVRMTASLIGAGANEIVNYLDKIIQVGDSTPDYGVLLASDPILLANAFGKGGPDIQMHVYYYVTWMKNSVDQMAQYGSEAMDWLEKLELEMKGISNLGPVASWRQNWVLDSIADLRRDLADAIEGKMTLHAAAGDAELPNV